MSYPERPDENAPVHLLLGIRVNAPIDRVWRLHTDIDGWTQWQRDIVSAHADAPLDIGTTFYWSTVELPL
jgi:uncharacterized protein YndB with AHSA1/START domain